MANKQKTIPQIIAEGTPERIKEVEVLNGLDEIAAYLRWSITKVRRAIKNGGLPATQFGSKYITSKATIDTWIAKQHIRTVETRQWDKKVMHARA